MNLDDDLLQPGAGSPEQAEIRGLAECLDQEQEDGWPFAQSWPAKDNACRGATSSPPVVEQLELLAHLSIQCSREKSLTAILEAACLAAVDGTVAQWAIFYQYHPDEHVLAWQAGVGSSAFRLARRQPPDGSNPVGEAWIARRLTLSSMLVVENRFLPCGAWSATRNCATASVAIHGTDEDPLGVLQIGLTHAHCVHPRDLLFLAALAVDLTDIIRHQTTSNSASSQATAPRAIARWPNRKKALGRRGAPPPKAYVGRESYG